MPFCRELNNTYQINQEQDNNSQTSTDEIEIGSSGGQINADTNEKDMPPRSLKRKTPVTQYLESDVSKKSKVTPQLLMKTVHLEIMRTLQKAIDSGNFYELWNGPFVEMETDGISSYVSDTSLYQQAQLMKQATALYFYSE